MAGFEKMPFIKINPKWGIRAVIFWQRKGILTEILVPALILAVAVICHGKPPQPEDIGTNFFLKASKSVPRIGRRTMEYENYFLKASKSIPRIGRRTLTSSVQSDNDAGWFPKDLPEPIKRSFFEKYFKENEQPVWNDLDYPGLFQGEEPYPDAGINPKLGPYRPRTKKDEEIIEEQPQNQEK